MKRVTVIVALVTLLIVSLGLRAEAEPGIITVGPPGGTYDYATIQEAIDAASAGDTIVIAPGTYHESLNIYKPLTLKRDPAATDPVIVDGDPDLVGRVVTVAPDASGIMVTGLEIHGMPGATEAVALDGDNGAISFVGNTLLVATAQCGIDVNGGATGIIIDHNDFTGDEVTEFVHVHGATDSLEPSAGADITNNSFSGSALTAVVQMAGPWTDRDNAVSSNTFDCECEVASLNLFTSGNEIVGNQFLDVSGNTLVRLNGSDISADSVMEYNMFERAAFASGSNVIYGTIQPAVDEAGCDETVYIHGGPWNEPVVIGTEDDYDGSKDWLRVTGIADSVPDSNTVTFDGGADYAWDWDDDVFEIYASNVTLQYLSFTGYRWGYPVDIWPGADDTDILNCQFVDCYTEPLWILGADTQISRCTFSGNEYAVFLGADAADSTDFGNCDFTDNAVAIYSEEAVAGGYNLDACNLGESHITIPAETPLEEDGVAAICQMIHGIYQWADSGGISLLNRNDYPTIEIPNGTYRERVYADYPFTLVAADDVTITTDGAREPEFWFAKEGQDPFRNVPLGYDVGGRYPTVVMSPVADLTFTGFTVEGSSDAEAIYIHEQELIPAAVGAHQPESWLAKHPGFGEPEPELAALNVPVDDWQLLIEDCDVSGSGRAGIYIADEAPVVVTHCIIHDNAVGVESGNAIPGTMVTQCDITGNDVGFYGDEGIPSLVLNWWGDASGPHDETQGEAYFLSPDEPGCLIGRGDAVDFGPDSWPVCNNPKKGFIGKEWLMTVHQYMAMQHYEDEPYFMSYAPWLDGPIAALTDEADESEMPHPVVAVPLENGWNLVSSPWQLTTPALSDLRDLSYGEGSDDCPVDFVLGYDTAAGSWTLASEVVPGKAYFVHTTARGLLALPIETGYDDSSVDLAGGWNLVGPMSDGWRGVDDALSDVREAGDGLAGWTGIVKPAYGNGWTDNLDWSLTIEDVYPTEGGWWPDGTEGVMLPAGGYWIHMENGQTLPCDGSTYCDPYLNDWYWQNWFN